MSDILVAYFSATGTTAGVAQKLAQSVQADLFEIEPAVPYTRADLNWMDQGSRSSVEMKDKNCRPAIKKPVADADRYKTVFVGFPIWWYREPSIIDTFMESMDLAGKTVVPFATSGGSGLGDSAENMQKLAPKAKVEQGKKFSAMASAKELGNWASRFVR